jgi:uncharacterized membrane protein
MENTIEEGKTAAITSYILIVGVLIAMSMNSEVKNRFASFHIRQALGLSMLFIILGTLISNFSDANITYAFWIFMMVLWSYGFITAIKGQMIAIPLLGGLFQKLFKAL